jgi:tRNA (guanosine-2'-O-)-methyltransferase
MEFAGTAEPTPWTREWTAEGVIQVLEPLVEPRRKERIADVGASRIDSVTVLMDAPHDPHNGAAVIRSCDAFGVDTLHVVLRDEPFLASRTVAKGSERWLNVAVHPTAAHAVQTLRQAGYRLVATHPAGTLSPEDLSDLPRFALVVGNEHDGIRDELARAADETVHVPMRGFVESLNVSVSAAILLAAATRHRAGDLTSGARRSFYAKGLYRSVSRAADVLRASSPR